MITRLKVDGFKNLMGVDIAFGKFNVVTGANGVGKSNLFDVIRLLSCLPKQDLGSAIKLIRGSERSATNLLFQKETSKTIRISVQTTEQSESVKYDAFIGVRFGRVVLLNEALFNLKTNALVQPDTDETGDLFEKSFLLEATPNRAIQFTRQWLSSLRVINLAPEDMRQTDSMNDPSYLGDTGLHLPAALLRLSNKVDLNLLSERLFELTGEIKEVRPRSSEDIESIWIEVRGPDGTWHNARALSDGTLRFLALAVLWLDPEATGVFCIEEPENGIHPSKIPALMRLLQDIAAKPNCQVIVNTHSPALVAQTSAEDIIVVYPTQRTEADGTRYQIPCFAGLKGTWREDMHMPVATISQVMDYLDPVPQRYIDEPLRLLDRQDAREIVERRRAHTWELAED